METPPNVVRTESIVTCEHHGPYAAIITSITIGDKTHTSKAQCPACAKETQRIAKEKALIRERGYEETQTIVQCQKHGEYTSTTQKYIRSDYIHSSGCPTCVEEWETQRKVREKLNAERRAEEQRRARIDRNRKAAAIPSRFTCCTLDGYIATLEGQKRALGTAKGFVENFDGITEVGSNMILCGKPGCGKTHLACAIGNYLLDAGRSVIYTQVIELVRAIRDTWRHDSNITESAVVEKYRTAGLLILDEVGVQFGSEAERTQLFDILDGRYRERRPTVIVSNLNGKALQECLGERLFDRITEVGSSVVLFDWKSYRRESKSIRSFAQPSDANQSRPN